jgi:hypothetical protein
MGSPPRSHWKGILHCQYPIPCLPLCQGSPVFCIFDMKGGAIPRCSSLLGRSLCSKYRRDVVGLHRGGYLPCPGHLHQQRRHVSAALRQELQKHHTRGDEREWRRPEAHGQISLSFFKLTRIERMMFRPIEVSVSCSNLSTMVTYEHADFASSPPAFN